MAEQQQETPVLHEHLLTSSETAYYMRGFMALLSKYAHCEFFKALFYALGSMTGSIADQFVVDVRTTYFSMLPHLIRQNMPFDFSLIGKYVVATSTYCQLDDVMSQLVGNPLLKQFGMTTVEFCNNKFLSVGSSNEKALVFLKAITLSVSIDNMNALLVETGNLLETSWKVINTEVFLHGLYNVNFVPQQFRSCVESIWKTYMAISQYVVTDQFAILTAVFLHEDSMSRAFFDWLGIKEVKFLKPVAELAPIYALSDVDTLFNYYELDAGKIEDTEDYAFDAWFRNPDCPELNKVVQTAKSNYHRAIDEATGNSNISTDKFAHILAAVDLYGEQLRSIRAVDWTWDEKSHEYSNLVDNDPAPAVLNRSLSILRDTSTKVYLVSNETSLMSPVIPIYLPVVTSGQPLVDLGKGSTSLPTSTFIQALVKEAGNAVLVLDNLILDYSQDLNKHWITTRGNDKNVLTQLKLLKYLLRGDASGDRFPTSEAPKIIAWRTVFPYGKDTYNFFNEMLTRLDVYYDVRYLPPARPHEPQCTLFCVRRDTLNINKFVGDEVSSRKRVSFVYRYVDFLRRYNGIIYRDMIHKHQVSPLAVKVIKSIVLKIISKAALIDADIEGIAYEFALQQKDFSLADKQAATSGLINYLGLRTGKSNAKGKRKADKDKNATFLKNFVTDLSDRFSTVGMERYNYD